MLTSDEKRALMARVRSSGSKAELLVFRHLRQGKIYFQKHHKKSSGSPDIALPRKKIAVFIDGDFWHGRDFERRKTQLNEYWLNKIRSNMARDSRINLGLTTAGWQILRVWESDLQRKSTQHAELEKIEKFLKT